MRILYINKYFHIVGGVEKYFFSLAELMKEKGHKIAFFSMTDQQNLHSDWNRYFVSNVSFNENSFSGRLRLLVRIFYSVEARQKLKAIIADFKPDIIHIHDIYHQISPSIIPEIDKSGIPMVQTLGNYHLISPNYSLFHSGKICEICKQKKS